MFQTNFDSGERVPKSTLIKTNVNISPEFILEIKTISAETDENMLRPKQISCMSKFCPCGKDKKEKPLKSWKKSKQGIKIESTAQSQPQIVCNTYLIKGA